jgi:hypothetical protein
MICYHRPSILRSNPTYSFTAFTPRNRQSLNDSMQNSSFVFQLRYVKHTNFLASIFLLKPVASSFPR